MGFKVTIRKNGAKHGEVHYSSEAVAVGMAQKMNGGGVKATVEKTAAKSNPRRRRNGTTSANAAASRSMTRQFRR